MHCFSFVGLAPVWSLPNGRDNHIRADHAKYKHWCHLCLCAFKHLDTLERHERNHHLYHRHGFGSGAGERNF